MNPLSKLEKLFRERKITKPDYIKKMHNIHQVLFYYQEFVGKTNIEKIDICDQGVIMTIRSSGIKILCDSNDYRIPPIEMLNLGDYEKEEIQTAEKIIKNNFTVLDVGANIGWYSLTLAKLFPHARFIGFEPIPKTFISFKKNIILNNLKNIKIYNLGLGDTIGEKIFYFYKEGSGNASLKNVSGRKRITRITCQLDTLDNFVTKHEIKVSFMKCDVEGGELAVIKGGINTIKRDRPIICLEMLRKWSAPFGYHPNDIIKLLSGINYSCHIIGPKGLKKFTRMTDKTKQTNFFFLPNQN